MLAEEKGTTKRMFHVLLIILGLLFSVTTGSFGQNDSPELIDLLRKDFVFRVVGYKEPPNNEWKDFDYTILGNYKFNLTQNCEFKIFFKEEILQVSFRYNELIFQEANNNGYTMFTYAAQGLEGKTGKKCLVGVYSILGDQEIYLAIGNDGATQVIYAIKLGL